MTDRERDEEENERSTAAILRRSDEAAANIESLLAQSEKLLAQLRGDR